MMDITVKVVHTIDPLQINDIARAIVNPILRSLNNFKFKVMGTLADIQAQNAALQAAVAAEDTVIDSAVVLIQGFGTTLQGLKDQLAAAIASNDPVAIQAVVDSLGATITDINTRKDALAAAVTAGTPTP